MKLTMKGWEGWEKDWQLLALGFLLQFFSINGQTLFISIFGGHIRNDLHLNHSEFGGYYSIATFFSALVLNYTGTLTDRCRLQRLTPAIILLLAISCIAMTFTDQVGLLIVVLFLLRHFGQGLFVLVSVTAVMRYIKNNHGRASSITRMGYSAAEGLMPMIVVMLLSFASWRSVWLIMAVSLVIIVIPLSLYLLKNHHQRHQQYLSNIQTNHQPDNPSNIASNQPLAHQRQYNRKQVLTDPTFYLILPTILSVPMLFTGFIFHQIQLLEEKNWQLSWWSGTLFIYSVSGAAFLLGSGLLIDRFSAKKMLFLIPIMLGIGLFILAYATGIQTANLAIIFISMAASLSACLGGPLFVELYGTQHLGSIKSLSTSLMICSTSISPFVIGFFLDQGYLFSTLLPIGSAYCLASALLLLPLYTTNHR